MPVQDLTPQLRTRLSRVERVVGLFVSVATLLLIGGFAFYIYQTGLRKGWWVFKAKYHTFVESAAGLGVGGDVRLLGFSVGKITRVDAMPPDLLQYGAVYLEFYVMAPYDGYIWSDSKVRVAAGDFLGGRVIEVLLSESLTEEDTNAVVHATYVTQGGQAKVYNDKTGEYDLFTETSKGYPLLAIESPAVTERLEDIASQAEEALPGILDLTNRVNLVLSNIAGMTAEAQTLLAAAGPMLSNVTVITANLKEPKGSLGEWALPTNLQTQLLETLASANVTLTNASRTIASTDTNVTMLATNLDVTLLNLANLTSNLNQQVQSNTNLVKGISDLIVSADDMIQGLKRHWLLRSAFKNKEDEKENENAEQPSRTIPQAGKWRR